MCLRLLVRYASLFLVVLSVAAVRPAVGAALSFMQEPVEGTLEDVAQTCDVEAVQVANIRQLHPILHDLVNTTFFRLFRVNLKNPSCPFWKKPEETASPGGASTCTGGGEGFASAPSFMTGGFRAPAEKKPCDVEDDEDSSGPFSRDAPLSFSTAPPVTSDDALDTSMSAAEQIASQARDLDVESNCEFEEDLPTYFADMCGADSALDGDLEDINLIKNPERNTGYNGSHIWDAMYSENCFEVGGSLPRGRFGTGGNMCYEERVLYRLLSGWHASTTISIVKYFYAPGTKSKTEWMPNPERYMKALGKYPERLKNLHFSFVVLLRAVKKASPFLRSYSYSTGDARETAITKGLIHRLLDSQVLSVCSPLFDAFDETRLFSSIQTPEQRSQVKRQFKSVFQNITVLVDCVQCTKCRLHAKLFSLGLGTALKILLTPPELMGSTTSRDEIVALVNVLWKLSETMEDARELTRSYWQTHGDRGATAGDAGAPPPGGIPSFTSTGGTAATTPTEFPISQPVAAGASAREAAVAGQPTDLGASERLRLLDMAVAAVRRAGTAVGAADEEKALRVLMARPTTEDLLIFAKHYAADRPDTFTRLVAAAANPSSVANQAIAGVVSPTSDAARVPDAIIIGGGLAGMSAAVSVLDRGGSIVLIDKQPYLGGNSGKASSGINAALETSVESLVVDTTKSAGPLARPQLIDKLANESATAVGWLRDRTGVDLSMRSQLGGHSVQRTLRPSNAFVGAELTFAIGQLLNKMAAEEPERCKILLKSKWTGLSPNGNEWDVTVTSNGTTSVLTAPAVIISSGGFGHDVKEAESLMLKHRPDLREFPTTLGPQTTGDGLKIARDIGAKLIDMDRVQLHPTGFVDPSKPREQTKTLAAELLRGVGGLMLDKNGSRFTNELGTRQAVVDAELRSAKASGDEYREFWLVLNGKAAAMADRHTTLYSKKGLLTKVQGLQGVARHTGIEEAKLRSTLSEYNTAAEAGKDAFGRTVFPTGHWPIEWDEEFYVGQVVPVIHYTMGGIEIDTEARVLKQATGEPIPGLYAIGEASGGVHGDNRLAGNSLLECTVFGRHVGKTLPIQASAHTSSLPGAKEEAAAPVEAAPETASARISSEALQGHGADAERKWIALYGKVYDLTDYIEEHPGGPEAITDVAGTDGTETFETVHNRELLESMGFEPIGNFEP